MSLYQFLACDSELPQLPSDGKRSMIDVSDLKIIKCNIETSYRDIVYYTNKRNIYSLEWDYSDDNCDKLWKYLQKINNISEIEIWSIWLCDYNKIKDEIYANLEKIKTQKCKFEYITFDVLKSSTKCDDSGATPNVLILD